jgi:hypothetical protein
MTDAMSRRRYCHRSDVDQSGGAYRSLPTLFSGRMAIACILTGRWLAGRGLRIISYPSRRAWSCLKTSTAGSYHGSQSTPDTQSNPWCLGRAAFVLGESEACFPYPSEEMPTGRLSRITVEILV